MNNENIHDCRLTYGQYRLGNFILFHLLNDGCNGSMELQVRPKVVAGDIYLYKCSKCKTPLIFSEQA